MTVAEMIARRTTELTAIKADSNAAVAAKGGTPADNLLGLPAAIASIPSGGELPELTNPAEVGHVVAGKEYIDAAGNKQTGTLVACDTIQDVETIGLPGVGVQVDLESTADGSTKTMTLPEPNLLPENIKSGVRIFGVLGAAKTLRVETGTITPAEDHATLTVPCTSSPKLVIVKATDVAIDNAIANNIKAAIKAVGTDHLYSIGADDSATQGCYAMLNVHMDTGKFNIHGRNMSVYPTVTISGGGYPWCAGMEYQWMAYYWEDT